MMIYFLSLKFSVLKSMSISLAILASMSYIILTLSHSCTNFSTSGLFMTLNFAVEDQAPFSGESLFLQTTCRFLQLFETIKTLSLITWHIVLDPAHNSWWSPCTIFTFIWLSIMQPSCSSTAKVIQMFQYW